MRESPRMTLNSFSPSRLYARCHPHLNPHGQGFTAAPSMKAEGKVTLPVSDPRSVGRNVRAQLRFQERAPSAVVRMHFVDAITIGLKCTSFILVLESGAGH